MMRLEKHRASKFVCHCLSLVLWLTIDKRKKNIDVPCVCKHTTPIFKILILSYIIMHLHVSILHGSNRLTSIFVTFWQTGRDNNAHKMFFKKGFLQTTSVVEVIAVSYVTSTHKC